LVKIQTQDFPNTNQEEPKAIPITVGDCTKKKTRATAVRVNQ
jgi:hypothetical protein